jgi:hypothetical protein
MAMCKQKLISIFSAIAIVGAASFANADSGRNNPLHPSYYQSMNAAPATQIADSDVAPYVDLRNPLNPSFGRANTADWMPTGNTANVPYVDSGNPLSPRFPR